MRRNRAKLIFPERFACATAAEQQLQKHQAEQVLQNQSTMASVPSSQVKCKFKRRRRRRSKRKGKVYFSHYSFSKRTLLSYSRNNGEVARALVGICRIKYRSSRHNCAVCMSVHVCVCVCDARTRFHRLFLGLCIQYLQSSYLPLS